jgi:nucleoside-diphosphate-sugar epimerase
LINKHPLVLVTGATGSVGPRVVSALSDKGYLIRTLSIDTPPGRMWPDNVEAFIGDITDISALHKSMEGVDSVIHMAALLHIATPPNDLQETYERINVGGTSNVVEAAIQAGVKRVVLFSTIAVYGPSDGCVLNELSPAHPETFYARTKLAAEKIVLNAVNADGQPLGTVLRLGAVYGSRIKRNYEQLIQALAQQHFIPIGSGRNRRTLVYDKDVGIAAVLAVSHPAAAGRIFNLTDGFFYCLNDIIESICSALGRKPPLFSLPAGLSRILAGVIEKCARSTGLNPPPLKSMIDKYTEDIAVDGSLIQKVLGFIPQYDLKTGWEETIKEMRKSGEL